MKLAKRSFLLLALSGACLPASAEFYVVWHANSLPFETEPLGWGSSERQLSGTVPWVGSVEGQAFYVSAFNYNLKFAMRQANAVGLEGSWVGMFHPGTRVLFFGGPVYGGDWAFSTEGSGQRGALVSGFGVRIQTQNLGLFRAQIRAYDAVEGKWSAWYGETYESTAEANGSALFMGIGSTSKNISRVQIRARSLHSTTYGYFGVATPRFSLSPAPPPGNKGG